MLFKKQISVFIAFLVLVSNSGLAFNVHFCEGKIASVTSVFSQKEVCVEPVQKEESCCAKKQQTHKKCCTDKKVSLKNKSEKFAIKTISLDFEPSFFQEIETTFLSFVNFKKEILQQNTKYNCDANAPPFYKLYCQLIFYA